MIAVKDKKLFRQHCYSEGTWISALSGKTFDIVDPATRQKIASVPDCGAAETQKAIETAEKVFQSWRKTTASVRSKILYRWYELMIHHQEDLALILTSEQGKPLAEAKGEILYAASFLQWFAEEAKRAYGEIIPSPFQDRELTVTQNPIGVCAAITPWNFPSAMITRKVAPALAAGCTIILKPAEQTPLSALALVELADRAGVPPGVFSVITGDPVAIGGVMTSSPIVRKLTFTGSTPVGKLLMQNSASTVKKLSLELGGNAPFIVFNDASLDKAVAGAMASKYRNSGQTCVSSNRFLIQEGIYESFIDALSEKVQDLRVGNGLDDHILQGPLIDEEAVQKVEKLLKNALENGAKLVIGGYRHPLGGTWFEPTVIRDITPSMAIFREEIFGPVAPILKFKTEEEAVALANDTDFGLAAYFFTNDHSRLKRVAQNLDYGMVGANTGSLSTEVAPFGGIKSSGLGREGSRHGLAEFMEIKYIATTL